MLRERSTRWSPARQSPSISFWPSLSRLSLPSHSLLYLEAPANQSSSQADIAVVARHLEVIRKSPRSFQTHNYPTRWLLRLGSPRLGGCKARQIATESSGQRALSTPRGLSLSSSEARLANRWFLAILLRADTKKKSVYFVNQGSGAKSESSLTGGSITGTGCGMTSAKRIHNRLLSGRRMQC
ncbi:hypothetical protein E2C01_056313 [Portunus trituberculatus]|uniref:Uncharacterized protein n=1 Tax=Portunus trituberculatus TaxID=210409 RepID=A0A5B7GQ32_PORTR|nr:hypothetical protein [Portunus trituberculatus]